MGQIDSLGGMSTEYLGTNILPAGIRYLRTESSGGMSAENLETKKLTRLDTHGVPWHK